MVYGKLIWGVMRLEPSGMELRYPDTVQDEKHIESTYLLYSSEFKEIQAIYRYADKLSARGRSNGGRRTLRSRSIPALSHGSDGAYAIFSAPRPIR